MFPSYSFTFFVFTKAISDQNKNINLLTYSFKNNNVILKKNIKIKDNYIII